MEKKENILYKEYWSDEYLITICGFANADGGKIFIGMDEDGKLYGVTNCAALCELISEKIIGDLGIVVFIRRRKQDGIVYIELEVPQSNFAVSYSGKYYFYNNGEDFLLTGVSLQALILKKSGKRWEDLPVASSSIEDIDEQALNDFIVKAIELDRLPGDSVKIDKKQFLINLGLMTEDGHLTNAALLLFGKSCYKVNITAAFKVARFGGPDGHLLFEDIIESNVFNMTDRVLDLLQAKYIKGRDIHSMSPNWEYPEKVLREMIINSLINKDYTGTYILMRVYDDRIYLWNPGSLPAKADIDTLIEKAFSRPYNPRIADMIFKVGHVHLLGSGIKNMLDACNHSGLPKPQIKEEFDGVGITIFKNVFTREYLHKYGLKERQMQALLFIKEHRVISNQRYQIIFGVSRRTATYDLVLLIKKGLIKRVGNGRGTYYIFGKVDYCSQYPI